MWGERSESEKKNWRKKLKYHMEWTILHSWIARRVSECDATKRKIRFDLIHVKRWRKEGWIECTVQPCIVFGLASAWHFMHTHTLTHAHSINQLIHPPRARARSPSCLSTCQTTKMYYPFFCPFLSSIQIGAISANANIKHHFCTSMFNVHDIEEAKKSSCHLLFSIIHLFHL